MRLLMLVAVIMFVIAAIAVAVPTHIAFAPLGWVAIGLAIMAFDFMLGGFVTPVLGRRANAPVA